MGSVKIKNYLHEGSFCFPDLDYNAQGNADHRGHCHCPPNAVTPVWICVHIIVFQGLVLDQEEKENSLKQRD